MTKTQDQLNTLSDAVAKLSEDVAKLLKPRELPGTVTVSGDGSDIATVLDGPSEEVPYTYRKVVDDTLNKSFGIHLISDGGRVKCTIIVPEKYATASPDIRPKVMEKSEGESGVLSWADRVFRSFDAAVQAQIVNDRTLEM